MGWMQATIPFGKLRETPVQEALFRCVLADTAVNGKVDQRIALFTREEGREHSILLLTPEAAKFVDQLPERWSDAVAIHEHRWGSLYNAGLGPADFGLKGPRLPGSPRD